MGSHISTSLHATDYIMCSDEDSCVIMEIFAGFNNRQELTISLDYIDRDFPENNCSTAVVVNIEDAFKMAKKNNVKYSKLPSFIFECMSEWREIINPSLRQTKDCFTEIIEALIEENCRYRLERTYGPNNFQCY